jgi:hypothetical protein
MNKLSSIIFCFLLVNFLFSSAQVSVKEGAAFGLLSESSLSRIIEGDENTFYSFRVKTKGESVLCFVEKHGLDSMNILFPKEVEFEINQSDNILSVFLLIRFFVYFLYSL